MKMLRLCMQKIRATMSGHRGHEQFYSKLPWHDMHFIIRLFHTSRFFLEIALSMGNWYAGTNRLLAAFWYTHGLGWVFSFVDPRGATKSQFRCADISEGKATQSHPLEMINWPVWSVFCSWTSREINCWWAHHTLSMMAKRFICHMYLTSITWIEAIFGKASSCQSQGTIGCTPNSVPMVLIGLI